MLKITVICVGKLKEQYLRDACGEYAKRLCTHCKLNVVELLPERLPDVPSRKDIENCLDAEGKRIIAAIPQGAYVFTMCLEGRQLSSEQLSRQLDSLSVSGVSNVAFVIGGSFGLSEQVKAKSGFRLSMSKMTFPHQLARVMLLEQIYRAMQISTGTKYHK